MPTFRHGKSTAVFVNQYDLSQFLNEMSSSQEVETGETTTFGSQAKSYIVGLQDGTMSASGLFETTATAGQEGIDPILTAALASEIDTILSYVPGGVAVGRSARIAAVLETSYEVSSPVNDVVSVSAEFQASGGIAAGVVLDSRTVTTATTTNGTAVDNGAASTRGGVAHFHVTANANAGSTTIKVQGSADNTTWVDIAGLSLTAAANTRTSGRFVVTGNIQRYVRAVATTAGAGAITYHALFARL